jgi:hypothetical protein
MNAAARLWLADVNIGETQLVERLSLEPRHAWVQLRWGSVTIKTVDLLDTANVETESESPNAAK